MSPTEPATDIYRDDRRSPELRDLTQAIINSWLSFYPNEHWIFLEFGLNSFEAFCVYVYEKVQPSFHKYQLFAAAAAAGEAEIKRVEDEVMQLTTKVGFDLFTIGLLFKNQLTQTVNRLNSEFESCQVLTPQVCSYQVNRLKYQLIRLRNETEAKWPIFEHADFSLVKVFIKDLLENVENNPEIIFGEHPDLPERVAPINKFRESIRQPPGQQPAASAWDENDREVQEFFENNKKALFPSEEDDVKAFLASHPELEHIREANIEALRGALKSKRTTRVDSLINGAGMVAKSIHLEGGEVLLVRRDRSGNKVYSKAIRSKWKNFNQITFDNVDTVMSIANSIKPHVVKSGFGGYFSQLNPAALTNVASLGATSMSSASGALGELLYDLMEGKKKLSALPKDLLLRTAQDLVISTIIGFSPFIAIAIAGSLGAFSVYSFVSNQTLSSEKKVQMIVELFTKGSVRSAITLGGAVLGNSLVPVPVLGSIVGGVTGGFLASFTFGAIAKLVQTDILLEPLAFYCLWMFAKYGCWKHRGKLTGAPISTPVGWYCLNC